jgi:hypothetical protein
MGNCRLEKRFRDKRSPSNMKEGFTFVACEVNTFPDGLFPAHTHTQSKFQQILVHAKSRCRAGFS